MRILANTAMMDKQQWLRLRMQGIGGSEAATTVGQNPYQTKFGLYLEKRGELPGFEGNERTKWGLKLEDVIAAEFKEANGLWVQRKNFMLQHDKLDHVIGNIDREIFCKDRGRGVLEIKNTGHFMGKDWGADEVPAQYQLQMQHYLAITGYEFGYFATLIGGNQYHQVEVKRDDEIIEILLEAETKFWEDVQAGREPELGGTDAEGEILKRLYPHSTKADALPLEKGADELVRRRQEIKAQLQAQDEELKAIENQLKKQLGEHERGYIDNTEVLWKNVTSNRVDTKTLKTEFPDVYKQVIKPSSSRRFEIKEAN